MKRSIYILLVGLILPVGLGASEAAAPLSSPQGSCSEYSDSFDSYNLERWQDVLLHSKERGAAAARDGCLTLACSGNEMCEVQVYSLFTFRGDFDVQVDYDVSGAGSNCDFNAGMVVQTPDDEKSYKCYVSASPEKKTHSRSRLDRFGDENLEKFKGEECASSGKLRIVRKSGSISHMTLKNGAWETVYGFSAPCPGPVRVRFKLQTGDETTKSPLCPLTVKFDNFLVNSCDSVVGE